MTIWLDPRGGSKDLKSYIKPDSLARISKELLPTDVMFTGRGPGFSKLQLGIEHKQLPDVLQCIQNGRFAGKQLIDLKNQFDFYWLFIEGIFRRNRDDGSIEVFGSPRGNPKGWYDTAEMGWGSRRWMYGELEGWLTTMEVIAGVKVRIHPTKFDSGRAIMAIYHWVNGKDWEEHKSHVAIDDSDVLLTGKSTCYKMIRGAPKVDVVTAAAVDSHFGSIRKAVNADVFEWSEIKIGRPGKRKRRIGVKTAKMIVDAFDGKEPEL